MSRRIVVAFEGIDGCGKSTQVARIAKYLEPSKVFKFPRDGTPLGQVIRSFLNRQWSVAMEQVIHLEHSDTGVSPFGEQDLAGGKLVGALALQSLMTLDKSLAAAEIEELRRDGVACVLDRFTMSAEAYGANDGLDPEFLADMNTNLVQFDPDLTFIIDVPVSVAMSRMASKNKDIYERTDVLEKVRARYLDLAKSGSCITHIIDGDLPADEVERAIIEKIEEEL